MKYDIPAVIFAGGKSSRMGEDKSLLPFGGYPTLSEYQYRRIEGFFDDVYLSAKTEKFDFDCKVITDRYEGASAMVALASALETLKSEWLFVLSVDAPFVDKNVIDRLLAHREAYASVIVARSPHGLEPLCALYHHSVMPATKHLLSFDNHRLTALLRSIKKVEVEFEEEEKFFNMNHPEEYRKALTLLEDISATDS